MVRDLLEALSREHADFVDKLVDLEACLDGMMGARSASEADLAILDEAVRFLEADLLPHLDREDRFLLPPLRDKIGTRGTLVDVVRYEHEEVRRSVGKIRDALADLKAHVADPAAHISELNRHGLFTIQFLWEHFRKEEQSLFPTAREALDPGELGATDSDVALE